MIELVKLPDPVPSVVLLVEIVGEEVVPQHTPRVVIVAPPSLEILPPVTSDVEVIAEIGVVVNTGNVIVVVKVNSFP